MEQQTANFIDENFTSIKLFLKSYGIHSNTKKWLSLIENIQTYQLNLFHLNTIKHLGKKTYKKILANLLLPNLFCESSQLLQEIGHFNTSITVIWVASSLSWIGNKIITSTSES